jgi:hypothetical protein
VQGPGYNPQCCVKQTNNNRKKEKLCSGEGNRQFNKRENEGNIRINKFFVENCKNTDMMESGGIVVGQVVRHRWVALKLKSRDNNEPTT